MLSKFAAEAQDLKLKALQRESKRLAKRLKRCNKKKPRCSTQKKAQDAPTTQQQQKDAASITREMLLLDIQMTHIQKRSRGTGNVAEEEPLKQEVEANNKSPRALHDSSSQLPVCGHCTSLLNLTTNKGWGSRARRKRKPRRPRVSLANLYCGEVPSQLKGLSWLEQIVIGGARAKLFQVSLKRLKGARKGRDVQKAFSGTVMSFWQDAGSFAEGVEQRAQNKDQKETKEAKKARKNKLKEPLTPEQLVKDHLHIVLLGSRPPTLHQATNMFPVRLDKLRNALTWLAKHNHHYHHLWDDDTGKLCTDTSWAKWEDRVQNDINHTIWRSIQKAPTDDLKRQDVVEPGYAPYDQGNLFRDASDDEQEDIQPQGAKNRTESEDSTSSSGDEEQDAMVGVEQEQEQGSQQSETEWNEASLIVAFSFTADINGQQQTSEQIAVSVHKTLDQHKELDAAVPHEREFVNDFTNPALWELSHPDLFPLGHGGAEEMSLEETVKMKAWYTHLVHLRCPRFRQSTEFLFHLYSTRQKRQLMQQAKFKVSSKGFAVAAHEIAETLTKEGFRDDVRLATAQYALNDDAATQLYWNKFKSTPRRDLKAAGLHQAATERQSRGPSHVAGEQAAVHHSDGDAAQAGNRGERQRKRTRSKSVAEISGMDAQQPRMVEARRRLNTLKRHVKLVGGKVAGMEQQRSWMRKEITAYTVHFGMPSLFVTINPWDVGHPLAMKYMGEEVDLDAIQPQLKSYRDRLHLVAKSPVMAARFFEDFIHDAIGHILGWDWDKNMPRTYASAGKGKDDDVKNEHDEIKSFMGGLFGPLKAFYGTTEAQVCTPPCNGPLCTAPLVTIYTNNHRNIFLSGTR
jgi:hypothetical protein